ncbi:two-component system response regulator [Denitratisoma sp. DHT3]|uniref:response regulator n=1 Tax=Denitratisoma sp. DHT3 TaxID=1981880 RepID=UPI0011984E28|nr:two-component system response regulator [Denitratisoma sp. DHT3]QDX82485.1 two-component system response regulator [Denitratisoma sp. DHT3]
MSNLPDPASQRPTILIVDDMPANLTLLTNLLKGQYRIKVASSAARALELAATAPPDLVLLDIMMPEMDGYEVCRRLKADERTQRVPVIFLTAKISVEDEELGLSLGAVDFIHKPISPPIVLARVKSQIEIKAWQDFLLDQNGWLTKEVDQRLSEINQLQNASIYVMVSLAEFRDEDTGNHIVRTQEYVRLLAQELATLPRHASMLTGSCIEQLVRSAPLHDIGKIAIPDHILLKPGKLTVDEFAIMKTHALRGYDILMRAGNFMGTHGAVLAFAKDIARHHHEKWDGTGYPDGLAGEAIPLAARLMAVADVYDALRSTRPYKNSMSHEQAADFIIQGRGRYFDPDVVDAFTRLAARFAEMAEYWPDE